MKVVEISDQYNKYHYTYSADEYDRSSNVDLRKDWKNIYKELNNFKLTEMVVHYKSIDNTRLHYIIGNTWTLR